MQLDQPDIMEQGLPRITQDLPKPISEASGPDPKAGMILRMEIYFKM
jgi:hypothetical protein